MSSNRRSTKLVGPRSSGRGVRPAKVNDLLKERVLRRMKRGMVAEGLLIDASCRPARYQYNWTYGDLSGKVFADDKSQARAAIKSDLGISKKKRLPSEVVITRLHNVAYQKEMSRVHANLQASLGAD